MNYSMLLRTVKATTAFIILFLTCAFHEAFGQDRFSDDSCATTSIKTTTIGAVLMQSSSSRMRLTADTRRTPPSHANLAGDPVDGNNATLSLEAVVATASGFVHNFWDLSSKAMDSFTKFYTLGVGSIASRDSTSTLILACLLLVLLGALAYILLQHVAHNGGNGSVPNNGLNVASRPMREPGVAADLLVNQRCESPLDSRMAPPIPLSRENSGPVFATQVPQGYSSNHERVKIPGFTVSSAASSAKMPSPRMPSPRQSRESPQDSQFCPELIVPEQSECILLMPIDAQRRRTSFAVTDVNGNLVLRVVPEPPSASRLWRATIQTSSGELLAQCCEARFSSSGGSAREFQLLRAGGDIFGKLRHSQPQDRYLLTLDRLFATTEAGASAIFDPNGKYARLRVAPLVDVGLAICGLLCIGQNMLDK